MRFFYEKTIFDTFEKTLRISMCPILLALRTPLPFHLQLSATLLTEYTTTLANKI